MQLSYADTLRAGLTIRILRKRSIKPTGHGSGPAMINTRPCKRRPRFLDKKFHAIKKSEKHPITKVTCQFESIFISNRLNQIYTIVYFFFYSQREREICYIKIYFYTYFLISFSKNFQLLFL